jgi:hypothetical protein
MKTYFTYILTYLLFLFIPCVGQEKIDKIRNSSWISVDYIKQMESRLPCECADSINYCYYISIASKTINDGRKEEDFIIPEVIVNYIIQTEASQYYILYEDSIKYIISGYDEYGQDKTYKLILRNDTLSLIDSSNNRKFIRSVLGFDYHTDLYLPNTDNITLLNKSLSLKGYPTIQTILKEDSLNFYCNAWLDNINMIYSRGKPKSWVLEIIDGYLFIRKIIDHADPLDSIKTEVIKILKWDRNNSIDVPKYEKIKVLKRDKFVSVLDVLSIHSR